MQDLIEEAGLLLLSKDTSRTLRRLREKHAVSAKELSNHLNVELSVISDYKRGRRASPGVVFLNKFLLGVHLASKE